MLTRIFYLRQRIFRFSICLAYYYYFFLHSFCFSFFHSLPSLTSFSQVFSNSIDFEYLLVATGNMSDSQGCYSTLAYYSSFQPSSFCLPGCVPADELLNCLSIDPSHPLAGYVIFQDVPLPNNTYLSDFTQPYGGGVAFAVVNYLEPLLPYPLFCLVFLSFSFTNETPSFSYLLIPYFPQATNKEWDGPTPLTPPVFSPQTSVPPFLAPCLFSTLPTGPPKAPYSGMMPLL